MISMEFLLASGIGVVTACGLWLLLRGRSFPVVLGSPPRTLDEMVQLIEPLLPKSGSTGLIPTA